MERNDIDGFESLWRLSRATEVLFPARNALMSTVWRQGNGIVETDRAISYASICKQPGETFLPPSFHNTSKHPINNPTSFSKEIPRFLNQMAAISFRFVDVAENNGSNSRVFSLELMYQPHLRTESATLVQHLRFNLELGLPFSKHFYRQPLKRVSIIFPCNLPCESLPLPRARKIQIPPTQGPSASLIRRLARKTVRAKWLVTGHHVE